MFVSSKTFMELVEKQTRMEFEYQLEIKRLEERIKTLEQRPILVDNGKAAKDSTDDMVKLYHEMTDGIRDEKAGRVILTDGRD